MTNYFNPKVFAAAVSVLIATAVAWLVEVSGVDVPVDIWDFLLGGALATAAGYAKGDAEFRDRNGEAGRSDPLYIVAVVVLAILAVWLLLRLVG